MPKNTDIIKKICALAAAASIAVCGGCSGEPIITGGTSVSSSGAPAFTSAAAIASEDELPRGEEKQPLRIAVSGTDSDFSPFYPEGELGVLINSLTGVKLLSRDRSGMPVTKGIAGESRRYNGSVYTYGGIADITEKYDDEAKETVYSITLRDGVYFSDGEPLTAEDVIFSLYFLLDPSFPDAPLREAGIKGELDYRLNCPFAEEITEDEIKDALAADEVKELIRGAIVEPLLKDELEWVKTLYGDSAYTVYTSEYPEPKDLLAFFYGADMGYDPSEADEQQVISGLADFYGGNYELLGSVYRGDAGYFGLRAESLALGYIIEHNGDGKDVDSISGIVKTGELSLDITVKGGNRKLPALLADVTVAPRHYYGDGFIKGNAAEKAAEMSGRLLGAGAYVLDKVGDGKIFLIANEHYYKGKPLTEQIEMIPGAADGAALVSEGAAEIAFPESSEKTLEYVENANRALEKLAAYSVSGSGYGFIGINAGTVNIGGDPLSGPSNMLRKALATAVYLFRDESVKGYFGGLGITADHPAELSAYLSGSGFSRNAPYSTDIDGEPVYSDYMDENARYDAAKSACLKFLAAAGYTVENKKVTAAPEGGKMKFRAIIAAGGEGDHPSYAALAGAKRLLGEIGITLDISDISDASLMWAELSAGRQELWAYVWDTGACPRMSEMYGENNLFGVKSDKLSENIAVTESSGDMGELCGAYSECYRLLFGEYAVEVPMYRRPGCILFSTLRTDIKTVPSDMTCYYGWTEEAEKIVRKK